MGRRACVLAALVLATGCGGGDDAPTYSRSEVMDAFSAEGIKLSEVGGELRSNQGFWLLVFDSAEQADARPNPYEGSGTLGQPEIVSHLANIVVYTAYDQLEGAARERVGAVLARLSRSRKGAAETSVVDRGAYGIRTRAAAVRGRCPRPLDECAERGLIVATPG